LSDEAAKIKKVVAIVDDDPHIRTLLCRIVEKIACIGVCYRSAEQFLEQFNTCHYDCIVTDYTMAEMNGMQLLDKCLVQTPFTPVFIVTGHHNIRLAVSAKDHSAYHFMTKPLNVPEFIKKLGEAVANSSENAQKNKRFNDATADLDKLTPREMEVFFILTDGNTNQSASNILAITIKTIEKHRANIGRKLGNSLMSKWIDTRRIYNAGQAYFRK
jgi:FixJ family two-component response regulator